MECSFSVVLSAAGSTKRLLDQELIGTESAPTVVGILLEVRVR